MVMKVCVTCSTEFDATQSAKSCPSCVNERKNKGRTKVCVICGDTFVNRLGGNRVCDTCKTKPKTCVHCGKQFMVKSPGSNYARNRVTCSRSCATSVAKVTRVVTCVDCSVQVVHQGRGRRLRCDTCTKTHKHKMEYEWAAKNKIKNPGVGSGGNQWGTNNPYFKHGKGKYVGDYRSRCLKNYEKVCQICDKPGRVDIHHIDGDKHNYADENLIPLCRSCHKTVHYKASELAGRELLINALDITKAEVKSRN